jgi:hypothetical protein
MRGGSWGANVKGQEGKVGRNAWRCGGWAWRE